MREENDSPICPIPGLGYCVRERGNFWDEERQECTGACFSEYSPLEALHEGNPDACTIYWTEDFD